MTRNRLGLFFFLLFSFFLPTQSPALVSDVQGGLHLQTVRSLPAPSTEEARAAWDALFDGIEPLQKMQHIGGSLRATYSIAETQEGLVARIIVVGSVFHPAPSCMAQAFRHDHLELGIDVTPDRPSAEPSEREQLSTGIRVLALAPGLVRDSTTPTLCLSYWARGDDQPLGPVGNHPSAVVHNASKNETRYYLLFHDAFLNQPTEKRAEIAFSLRVVGGQTGRCYPEEIRWGLPPVSGVFPGKMIRFKRSGHAAPSAEKDSNSVEDAIAIEFEEGIKDLRQSISTEAEPQLRASHRAQIALLSQLFASLDAGACSNTGARRRVAQASATLGRVAQKAQLNSYLSGAQRLTFAISSPDDGRLSAHGLRLPQRALQNGQKPPLLVVLHGKGNPEESAFLADLETTGAPTYAPEAMVLTPYARGNMGYRDGAERDVMAAIESLVAAQRVDPSRIMLMGFSMGGAGAWAMAVHHPDVWSGVAIAAGGSWLVPRGLGLGANLAHVPVHLWHGLKDTTIDPQETRWLVDELHQGGSRPQVTWDPDGEHQLPKDAQERLITFLLATQQVKPAHLTYATDGFSFREAYGIRVAAQRGHASRVMRITRKHQAVSILIKGDEGFDIDLNRFGGPDDAQIRLLVNRRELYFGPKTQLQIAGGSGR